MTESITGAAGAITPIAAPTTGAASHLAAVAPPIAATAAETAAPVGHLAARGGRLSGTGWFGLSAGAAGVALTLMDAWRNSVGTQRGFDTSSAFGPTTAAIGGGAALLLLGEKSGISNAFMRNGMKGAGVTLVLGGLLGAVVGATRIYDNPLADHTDVETSTQSQTPTGFAQALPPAPAHLDGIELAIGEVVSKERRVQRVPVYADPATAKPAAEGATLGYAIGEARAASQGDDQDRSHAVVKTVDDKLWIVRMTGDLDQIDGRHFSRDTGYDARYEPLVGKRQAALQAIAGVENYLVFPAGTDPKDPVQEPGDIPWLTPSLPATPLGSSS